MQMFSKLKLVSAQVERFSPVMARRAKLTSKIDHQIAAAKAAADGVVYAAKRQKFVKDDETGARKQVEADTKVKHWWWTASSGKLMLAIKYGAKTIELAKGKNAIELASLQEVIDALGAVKEAVVAGELDAQIELVSGSLRAGFGKKTKAKA